MVPDKLAQAPLGLIQLLNQAKHHYSHPLPRNSAKTRIFFSLSNDDRSLIRRHRVWQGNWSIKRQFSRQVPDELLNQEIW